ncbi:hypothetical protein AB0E67_08265 [Streptomyces sp. NPDC032161]|uniref:hypothetical protein n=1 Tax=unclassified Streptomyces TaxID=2593676 RepID=UPI0033E53BCF
MSPIQPLPASYEEIRDRVGAAVRRLLAAEDGTWACVEATYPDRVIVSVHQDGADPVNYAVPYDKLAPGDIPWHTTDRRTDHRRHPRPGAGTRGGQQ